MTKSSSSILSDDHINAIGRLVVAVSKIDSLLTDLIAIFMWTDILSAISAVHHQQIASKVDTLKTLIKLNSLMGTTANALQLLSEAKAIADYRNALVHAHWTIDKEGETYAVRFQARGEFKRSRQATYASQIRLKAHQADGIADRLGAFRDHLLATASQTPHSPKGRTPHHPQD
jgi:hypothetical protein